MRTTGTRKKSITFRLLTEEYNAVKDYCAAKNFRSVSELARESILERIYGPRMSSDLAVIASAVDDTVQALKNLSGKLAEVCNPSQ